MIEYAQENAQKNAQENGYEIRPLVATDMGAICKIITAIGIRQFKECFKVEDFKGGKDGKDGKDGKGGKSVEEIGFGVVFDIAGIVIANIPKAEEDIQTFVASVTGLSLMEVKGLPFADYGELIVKIVSKEDFRDFFSRVMKLFNR